MIAPRKLAPFEKGFSAYTVWYFKKNFHGLYLLGDLPALPPSPDTPLLVLLNHSGWWDVLTAIYLATRLIHWRQWYGVMDERQLERYRFFAFLGMIGVDRTTIGGVKEFLRFAQNLMTGRPVALFVTPQGEMISNAARPLRFESGVGALVESLPSCHVLTVTLHYEFWNEPKPEAFVSFSPVRTLSRSNRLSRREFVKVQEAEMTAQLDTLLEAAQARDYARFTPLLSGSTGIAPLYDLGRTLAAKLTGRTFTAEHSGVVSPPWKSKHNARSQGQKPED